MVTQPCPVIGCPLPHDHSQPCNVKLKVRIVWPCPRCKCEWTYKEQATDCCEG